MQCKWDLGSNPVLRLWNGFVQLQRSRQNSDKGKFLRINYAFD